jgi:hypothetical protein
MRAPNDDGIAARKPCVRKILGRCYSFGDEGEISAVESMTLSIQ